MDLVKAGKSARHALRTTRTWDREGWARIRGLSKKRHQHDTTDESLALAAKMVQDGVSLRKAAALAGTGKWSKSLKGLSKKHKIGASVEWGGKLYYKTEKGYWRCKDAKKGKTYLHRDVWAAAMGPIAEGWHVHHKDHNPDNWALENLELLLGEAHNSYHGKLGKRAA